MAYQLNSKQHSLRQQLSKKEAQLEVIVQKISAANLNIYKLSQKFYIEAAKIQQSLSKVQASRPRGNPANQWPHRPMTPSLRGFFQAKENKERKLWQKKKKKKSTTTTF